MQPRGCILHPRAGPSPATDAAALALVSAQACAGETQVPVNCGDRQAYPAQTVLLLRNGEPFVFVDFQKQFPPAQKKLSILKECLMAASKTYQGKQDIYSGLLFKGIDDTEHAENLSVCYSQKTKSVKVAKVVMP